MSAVAAVALVNPDAAAEPEQVEAVQVVVDDAIVTQAPEVEVPEIASSEDLKAACGEQGMLLVDKEADGLISPLEQAALDSLRAICAGEGAELPGPPAPGAVVETVTVAASSSDDDYSDDDDDDLAADFEEEYAETVAYINALIAAGAQGEMIDLATALVAEAAALADAGDYEAGMDKLDAAEDAADLADLDGRYDDDEYDDDYEDDEDDDDEDDDDDDEDDDDDDEDDEDEDDDDDEDDD